MKKHNFRTPYTGHVSVPFETTGLSLTKQSFKAECDVNNILRNYNKTGVLPENFNPGEFRDVTGIDYQESMQMVASASSMFNELPSALRKRFKNDPAELLAFTSDDKNIEEAHKLGLLREGYQKPEVMLAPPQTAKPIDETSE